VRLADLQPGLVRGPEQPAVVADHQQPAISTR
jgi:hypothetical protein